MGAQVDHIFLLPIFETMLPSTANAFWRPSDQSFVQAYYY